MTNKTRRTAVQRFILAGAVALAALIPATAGAAPGGPTGPPGTGIPLAHLHAKWDCSGPDTVEVVSQEQKSTITWVKWHVGTLLVTDQRGTVFTLDEAAYGGSWQRVKARVFFDDGTWRTMFIDAYTCVG